MTYRKFFDSSSEQKARLCRVTYARTLAAEVQCDVLEWEASNAKWYKLQPFEGRHECGYANEIWLPNNVNAKILDVQVLTSYV